MLRILSLRWRPFPLIIAVLAKDIVGCPGLWRRCHLGGGSGGAGSTCRHTRRLGRGSGPVRRSIRAGQMVDPSAHRTAACRRHGDDAGGTGMGVPGDFHYSAPGFLERRPRTGTAIPEQSTDMVGSCRSVARPTRPRFSRCRQRPRRGIVTLSALTSIDSSA